MKLKIEWSRPITLTNGASENLLYTCDPSKLSKKCGIYVFGRQHGSKMEALYVGKADVLQSRVRGQFKNLPLMMHLKNAKTGKRIVLVGQFVPKPGQQQDKCLKLLERALIRHFLSEGHDLVNIQGSIIRRHEISCIGAKQHVPEIIFVDRQKGE